MKLSVIVPVYKVEGYLADCVDSLLGQSLRDLELILVDDGSPDCCGEMIDGYAQKYPGVVKALHIDNGGQGRARNFGIDLAQGEYLGFVDSDDWVDARMYEKLCQRADDTGADLVVCDFLCSYENGRQEYLSAGLQDHWLASAGSSCNKLFRRSAVGRLRFPTGLWYEDFYFSAVMLLRSGRTEYVPEPLYVYRQCQNSTMHNQNSAKNLDLLRIMDMLEAEMLPDRQEDFEFFLVNHVLLDAINRLAAQDSADKRKTIARMRAYVRSKLPRLSACRSYKQESRNRRIIMYLNYTGHIRLAQLLLRIKSQVK